jgi:hypothetical protein
MVVAFDYDGTLDDIRLQEFAAKLRRAKHEIWVVTMRRDNELNRELIMPVMNRLGLSRYNIIFCNEKPKHEYLKAINADVYIDNISDEFKTIINHSNTIPLLWGEN